jgi:biopolymer transport protein ExbD
MKINRARINNKPRIEIIPMVDIMFFLLATLLIATISLEKHQALPVNLVQGSANNINTHNKLLNITINAENKIFINQKATNINNLSQELNSITDQQNTSVVIFADEKAYQGEVLKTILAINKMTFKQVSMAINYATPQN